MLLFISASKWRNSQECKVKLRGRFVCWHGFSIETAKEQCWTFTLSASYMEHRRNYAVPRNYVCLTITIRYLGHVNHCERYTAFAKKCKAKSASAIIPKCLSFNSTLRRPVQMFSVLSPSFARTSMPESEKLKKNFQMSSKRCAFNRYKQQSRLT